MAAKHTEHLTQFRPSRILLPALLGLGVVAYLLYAELARESVSVGDVLRRMAWTPRAAVAMGSGLLMVVLRDFGYMWQLRVLTSRELPWVACMQIVLLWDFFAAVSPSMVGGAALAVFMLVKERISLGRSTAIVFTAVFLDQVFYTTLPFAASFFVRQSDIFAPLYRLHSDLLGTSMMTGFWIAWSGLMAYVVLLLGALFVAPHWINALLKRLFALPVLRRWRSRGMHMTGDLLTASEDLRSRSNRFWFEAWAATSVAWMGRYLVLNCVIEGFSPTSIGWAGHMLTIGRQTVLSIVMVLSPTPGSSGIAELGFSWLMGDLLPPGAALGFAVLWRLLTYYPYLLIGVPVMTHWIRRVYGSDIRQRPQTHAL